MTKNSITGKALIILKDLESDVKEQLAVLINDYANYQVLSTVRSNDKMEKEEDYLTCPYWDDIREIEEIFRTVGLIEDWQSEG